MTEGRKDGREEILHRSSLPSTCHGRPGGVSAGAVWGRVASLRVLVSWQNWGLDGSHGARQLRGRGWADMGATLSPGSGTQPAFHIRQPRHRPTGDVGGNLWIPRNRLSLSDRRPAPWESSPHPSCPANTLP